MIFVTGKGGTGKTTLSASLALAIARDRAVTLVTLDERSSAASPALDQIDHPNLKLIAVTRRGELEAFIQRIVPVKMIARRMLGSRTFGFVTTALPGLEAFLILEKIRLIAQQVGPGSTVVVDGPATGGALELLSTAKGLKQLAPHGTLHRLAEEIEGFQQDRKLFGVMITLRPEELALREALAAVKALQTAGVACAGAILNHRIEQLFSDVEIAALTNYRDLYLLARKRDEIAAACVKARREMGGAGVPVAETPALFSTATESQHLKTLADLLRRSIQLQ